MNPVKSKLNSISFVKGNSTDSQTDNESLTPKDESQHFNIKYVKPIDQKSSWLKPKNRSDDWSGKNKPDRKSGIFYNKQKLFSAGSKNSAKAKTYKSLKTHNGRSIKITQIWIPKGLINHGPK